jgi:hypothetical protein
LRELTDDEVLDSWKLVRRCTAALKKEMKPDGFNIGINLGKVAGAGIIEHLHIHIVPRWNGDTNFMPVIAGVGVVPQALRNWRTNFGRRWRFNPFSFHGHQKRLHFDNARFAQQLYQQRFPNARRLENQLGVKATVRDGWIKLDGAEDALERAKQLVQVAGILLKAGHPLRAIATSPTR